MSKLPVFTPEQRQANLAKAIQVRLDQKRVLEMLASRHVSLNAFLSLDEGQRVTVKRVVKAYVAGVKGKGVVAVNNILADLFLVGIRPDKRVGALNATKTELLVGIVTRL